MWLCYSNSTTEVMTGFVIVPITQSQNGCPSQSHGYVVNTIAYLIHMHCSLGLLMCDV